MLFFCSFGTAAGVSARLKRSYGSLRFVIVKQVGGVVIGEPWAHGLPRPQIPDFVIKNDKLVEHIVDMMKLTHGSYGYTGAMLAPS